MKLTENPPFVGNSFETILRTMRKGRVLSDLSEKMQTAVLAVKEHSREAVVTLTIRISPANTDASALSVSDEIKTKLPEPKKPNTLFYSTDEGVLVREDPNQAVMKFEIAEPQPTTDTHDQQAIS